MTQEEVTASGMMGRRSLLRAAGPLAGAAVAAAGVGALAGPTAAQASSQAGPLQITGSDTHVALIGTGTAGNYGTPQDEPSIYRMATDRLGVRARTLMISPWVTDLNHSTSGDFSALLVLARDTNNNDNSILFCSVKEAGTGNDARETQWVIEQAGDKHLVIKDVHDTLGDGATQSGTFTMRLKLEYPTTPTDYCNIATSNANVGIFDAENWTSAKFGGGKCVLAMDAAEVAPTTNPATGVVIYVDSSGNLKARTKNGNVRTIAAV